MDRWKLEPAKDHGLSLGDSFASLRREDGLLAAATHVIWWSLIGFYLKAAHRVKVEGAEHLPPAAPFILIANHCSHLDTMVLASSLPLRQRAQALPVAAGDTFFTTPAKKAFAALALNALPLWRNSGAVHAMKALRQRMEAGDAILILFPEGTRSRDGNMVPFKPGLGMIVAGLDVPVVPCYLDGCHRALPPGRSLPRLTPLKLIIGRPHSFADIPNNREGWTKVSDDLREAIESLKPSV